MLSTACLLSQTQGAHRLSANDFFLEVSGRQGSRTNPFSLTHVNKSLRNLSTPSATLSYTHPHSPVKPHYGFLAHPDWVRNYTSQSLGLPRHPPLMEVYTCLPHRAIVRRNQIIYCWTFSLKDRVCSRECKILPFTFFFKKKKRYLLVFYNQAKGNTAFSKCSQRCWKPLLIIPFLQNIELFRRDKFK